MYGTWAPHSFQPSLIEVPKVGNLCDLVHHVPLATRPMHVFNKKQGKFIASFDIGGKSYLLEPAQILYFWIFLPISDSDWLRAFEIPYIRNFYARFRIYGT